MRLEDVPFPPPGDPAGLVQAGLLRGGDPAQRKKKLHKALLRWHPDKNQGDPHAEEIFKRVPLSQY